jgi:hypothetical protein
MGRASSTNGEKRNAYRILVGEPDGKRPREGQDVSGWIILKWILERQNRVVWTGLMWLRIGTGEGSCEHDNEYFSSTKCWEVLE